MKQRKSPYKKICAYLECGVPIGRVAPNVGQSPHKTTFNMCKKHTRGVATRKTHKTTSCPKYKQVHRHPRRQAIPPLLGSTPSPN